ncbi:DUF5304 domain-containing protein [Streptomyces turgidiscabies]|uniref:DUF5304 domain-containing protein n=1 Tax=Streptomyces turgidiscabies TaxID=85558 RepID=A0ABU0RHW8_9ACTN|nr:DUF5304 domain-containing protein [Streptomyces turgidiscabies]MBW8737406.1 DUF5304 domain-containing protein [Streptomyces turgidiscabies]MDQ0931586.1 hypothetical protein [Streptomyces turgidiscabies]
MSEERPTSDAARGEAAAEAPYETPATDDDAWAKACAEDLEAEKARRRAQHGPPPGSAAEELRKLVDAVSDKLSSLQSPLLGAVAQGTAQQVVRQVVQQAKAAVEPVIERNPDVFDHLAAAGNELFAAYRSAVESQERRWTTREADRARKHGDDRGEGTGSGERIDLD